MRYERRKSAYFTSHAYRFECMTAKDFRTLKSIKKSIVLLLALIVKQSGDVLRNKRLLAVFSREYFRMQYVRRRAVER